MIRHILKRSDHKHVDNSVEIAAALFEDF